MNISMENLVTQLHIAVGDSRRRLSLDELVERVRRQAIGNDLWEHLEDPRIELYFSNGWWNACFTDDDNAIHLAGNHPRSLMETLSDELADEGVL